MEQKILEVLRKMQGILQDEQFRERLTNKYYNRVPRVFCLDCLGHF